MYRYKQTGGVHDAGCCCMLVVAHACAGEHPMTRVSTAESSAPASAGQRELPLLWHYAEHGAPCLAGRLSRLRLTNAHAGSRARAASRRRRACAHTAQADGGGSHAPPCIWRRCCAFASRPTWSTPTPRVRRRRPPAAVAAPSHVARGACAVRGARQKARVWMGCVACSRPRSPLPPDPAPVLELFLVIPF